MLYPQIEFTAETTTAKLWYSIQLGRRRIGGLRYLVRKALERIYIDRGDDILCGAKYGPAPPTTLPAKSAQIGSTRKSRERF